MQRTGSSKRSVRCATAAAACWPTSGTAGSSGSRATATIPSTGGSFASRALYHPARLNHPLKRAGSRGEGRWQRISWDEALATIAERLHAIIQEQGPEAVCLSRGSGLYYNAIMGYFAYLLGTPNVMASGYICFQPAGTAVKATIGYPQPIQATEVVGDEPLHSACILLWAANPGNSYPYPFGEGIPKAQKGGTKLIVVDPRPTPYARSADLWLQLRPATDDALALGRQIEKFRSREPAPRIELNPETAKAEGISQGDCVKVESVYFGDERQVRFQADLVEGLHPRVAAVEHGWWFPEQGDPEHGCFASNVNAIIPNDLYDPLFGSANLKSVRPCRIARA